MSRFNPPGGWKKRTPPATMAQIPTGPLALLDAMGRELGPGDIIALTNGKMQPFRVQQIVPAVQPNVPPGVLKVVITCQLVLLVQGNRPDGDLVLIATDAEQRMLRGEAPAEDAAAQDEGDTQGNAQAPPPDGTVDPNGQQPEGRSIPPPVDGPRIVTTD